MKNVLYIVLSFLLLTGCLGLLDKIFGTRKRFIITSYENGQKRTEVNFNHGRGNGLGTLWYENGQKEREGNYKNGKEDGLWTSWYDNGQKEIESNFTDGEPHGLLTFWFETGQVRRNKI